MLSSLDIRDLLIIDRLTLEFRPGLNVLTGETGAGKSILLDALGFVLGWRGRADLVRQGASQGEVEAVFTLAPDHPGWAVLDAAGLPADPKSQDVIIRRINRVDGRKTAWINDRRVSGEVLRGFSERLVELHGQHDDRGLLNPRGHRQLLDGFGRHDAALARTRAAWRARCNAQDALEQAQARLQQARADEDFLRHAVAELNEADPRPGEEAELDAARRLMQGAEKIRGEVARAHEALGGAAGATGAEGLMADALRRLEAASGAAGPALDAPLAALSRAMAELDEATTGVETCLRALEFDPLELENTEERLFAIRALARKHGVLPDELGDLAVSLRKRLDDMDRGADDIANLQDAASATEAAFVQASTDLSAARQSAARRLDKAMAAELAPLKMDRAEFTTGISAQDPGPEGTDMVAFTVATNPGAPAGPLGRIASGGELSRFLLALKVCLTAEDSGLSLIFDEIDRGVGGATADAVGRRLADLAQGAQVLAVTHSPQVAARGAHHWRVEKTVVAGQTLSRVIALDPDERVEEVARMMSGDKVTDAARAAAKSLLQV